MDDVEEPEQEPKGDDVEFVYVDMKGADTLYWVYWPSLIQPDMRYMIGWPMRLRGPQQRTDN